MKGDKGGMNINCREALHSVYHFLDGEMTPERRDQIARHIDKCAPCLRAFGFETEIRRLIADRCRDKVPEELKSRIAAVIAHEIQARRRSRRSRRQRGALTVSDLAARPPYDAEMTPQPEPVAWDIAERVAGRVARRTDTRIDWATLRSLVIDFEEVTAQAEALVEKSTGLRSLVGPARAQVADREEWIHANVSSFRRLLGPVLARAGKGGQGLSGLLGPVGRVAAGAEMGAVLGWMSGRVLGQYDLLFADGDSTPGRGLLRGAEHRLAGASARVRAPGVPALDRAARADSPCPVHRRAVAARPLLSISWNAVSPSRRPTRAR